MITEDYCSFELSKLLKEKGFDEPCFSYYKNDKSVHWFEYRMRNSQTLREYTMRPYYGLAMKWLREVHKLFIDISFQKDEDNSVTWFYMTWALDDRKRDVEEVDFTSYEEAVEAAIKYVLEKFELSTEEFDPYMED